MVSGNDVDHVTNRFKTNAVAESGQIPDSKSMKHLQQQLREAMPKDHWAGHWCN
jgi:hypothetical protein